MTTAPVPERRVALITGAAGALGSAIARKLAGDGYQLALADIAADAVTALAGRMTRDHGIRASAYVVDISDPTAVKSMFDAVNEQSDGVAVLVNNAGVLRNAPLLQMRDDDWDSVIDIHLKGAFLCSRAAAVGMISSGWGRIVNISSGAIRGSNRGHANYSAAKAGLIGLTKTLAVELGPFGITANAVAPGAIESEMTRATAAQIGETFQEYTQRTAAAIPLRRLGTPDDVAAVVGFFTSPAADYVTGQVLYVSGGP